MTVHHRYVSVRGQRLFYREAGRADAPVVLLLHGFPASSFMFRGLIPALAGRYHVIAPDHLGSGLSDAPPADEFPYTFDTLAELTAGLVRRLGVASFALCVQGYGAAIGWRLALAGFGVTAIVTHGGSGSDAGFGEHFWAPLREHWRKPTPETELVLRELLTLDAIRWAYLHGVADQSLVSPDTWYHDFALLSRPGNDAVQLSLMAGYAANLPLYPRLHAYLRESRVPLLVLWGRGDEIFGVDAALAFAEPAPHAEICLLDGGHFLLESHLDEAASTIRRFLDRTQFSPERPAP